MKTNGSSPIELKKPSQKIQTSEYIPSQNIYSKQFKPCLLDWILIFCMDHCKYILRALLLPSFIPKYLACASDASLLQRLQARQWGGLEKLSGCFSNSEQDVIRDTSWIQRKLPQHTKLKKVPFYIQYIYHLQTHVTPVEKTGWTTKACRGRNREICSNEICSNAMSTKIILIIVCYKCSNKQVQKSRECYISLCFITDDHKYFLLRKSLSPFLN